MKTKDIKSKVQNALKKAETRKKEILENANKLADRIINKAIAKEKDEEEWNKKKKELKEIATKKRKEAALAKREARNNKRAKLNKTIPLCHVGKCATKEDIEKYNLYVSLTKEKQQQAQKEINEARTNGTVNNPYSKLSKENREKALKRKATNKVHHKNVHIQEHTTKEQRIESAKQRKVLCINSYKKELQKQASEIEADPKGYQNRQEKKQKKEQDRLNMLAEKRKARLEKLQKVELTQKQKTIKDIEHFKQAQLARTKKKLERKAMYLTKGNTLTLKVKNKVEIRPVEPPKEQPSNKHRYIVRTQYIDQSPITGDRVGGITCLVNKLGDIVKYSFNRMMKSESDKLVGYFVYDTDNPEVCIMEMVNSKYRNIDGVTTTRMQQQKENAA